MIGALLLHCLGWFCLHGAGLPVLLLWLLHGADRLQLPPCSAQPSGRFCRRRRFCRRGRRRRRRRRCCGPQQQDPIMNNIKATQGRNEMEIASGLVGDKSWHAQYKDSAYVYVGGFPYDLTEGDLIAVMSQCVPRARASARPPTARASGACLLRCGPANRPMSLWRAGTAKSSTSTL
jgi:hypothetical protein